ncbi:N-terminal acetyltransferase [Aspergillus tanneri]|uniref:N-terminal acetyltransferase n=1 Tax=Aspergillus tanneri TaxID=1220188 RepID=A0A5M9MIG7_9EURO|nr:N-terminal acetyltransferase [Aspergillus tanneri]KAA8645164.1 N-terminal acetyltransferase [Aspergillus tanneri]
MRISRCITLHPIASTSLAVLYRKLMGRQPPGRKGRGGYFMEFSIFFHHILRVLGFHVYMTGIRAHERGSHGEYQGLMHIVNIIHLPGDERYAMDVAFGGDGPINPLPMRSTQTMQNPGSQQLRHVHDHIPKQRLHTPKPWIYQYATGPISRGTPSTALPRSGSSRRTSRCRIGSPATAPSIAGRCWSCAFSALGSLTFAGREHQTWRDAACERKIQVVKKFTSLI